MQRYNVFLHYFFLLGLSDDESEWGLSFQTHQTRQEEIHRQIKTLDQTKPSRQLQTDF